jgi:predicted hotdog family 3-hydroxylacyl-ACP dehydratase
VTRPLPDVTELVPHQPPVLALERLTSWQKEHAVGELTIRADNPLLLDGKVETVMALEYMAQCVAACLGMEAYVGGGDVRVGMVIACRQMRITAPHLLLGQTYRVTADQVRGTDAISHYDGAITDADGAPVATCTMTLVHGEKPPE